MATVGVKGLKVKTASKAAFKMVCARVCNVHFSFHLDWPDPGRLLPLATLSVSMVTPFAASSSLTRCK